MKDTQKAQTVEEMAKSYFGIKSLRRHNDELSYIDGFKDAVQWHQSQSDLVSKENQLLRQALADIRDLAFKTGLSSISADYIKPNMDIEVLARKALGLPQPPQI